MTELVINRQAIFKATGTHTKRNHKPVINLDTGAKYASATDAAEALGCGVDNVSSCCTGRTRTCKGYQLAYVAHASQNVDILTDRIAAMYHKQDVLERKAKLYDESQPQLSEIETLRAELTKANERLAKLDALEEQKKLVAKLECDFQEIEKAYAAAERKLEEERLMLEYMREEL